jgi:calpain-15
MRKQLQANAKDDGNFWMSFKDFTQHFKALNVCKIGDWEELRVKGEFTNQLLDNEHVVKTKYYYEIQVQQKQKIFVGVHQEDERIQDMLKRMPYMTVGVAILQKNKDATLDLVHLKEFSVERQVEFDVELEPGEYIIVPRSSGCSLQRPKSA